MSHPVRPLGRWSAILLLAASDSTLPAQNNSQATQPDENRPVKANWALAKYIFQMNWIAPNGVVLLLGWLAVSAVTVATGLLSSRGICDHPPLEVLRQET